MTFSSDQENTYVAFDKQEIEQSIPARFEKMVLKHSDRLAIKMEDEQLTYRELNNLSNMIGARLLESDPRGQKPVAILMAQSIQLIAAIIGTLKAAKIYVPIDPATPEEIRSTIFREAGISTVLTDHASLHAASSASVNERFIINVDSIRTSESTRNLGIDVSPGDSAYIFYTSGSTGRAKGVVDSHRNVLHNIMRYTNNLRISCDDRLTLLQVCSFSGSVSSLFCALLNGASIFPFDVRREGISKLSDLLISERVTIYHSVPSLFEQLMHTRRNFESLRCIRLEGDRCSTRHVELYQRNFTGHCILANGLGATETGLTHQYIVEPDTIIDGGNVPVGYAMRDIETIILDDNGRTVANGMQGEIAIKSAYLATGYWQDSELTESSFKRTRGSRDRLYRTGDLGLITTDGKLEHYGRKDFQIRIRGQAVNSEVIEDALMKLPGISQAVVHGHEIGLDHQRLVAYLIPDDLHNSGQAINESWCRDQLLSLFPAYMIPARFLTISQLPMDTNGKISRKDLPPPDEKRPSLSQQYVDPQSDTEIVIAKIWQEMLSLERVGIHDDFFDLGGDSMLAIVLPMFIEEKTGVKLGDASLLEASTIFEISQLVDRNAATKCLVSIQPKGTKTPLFFIHAHTGRVLEYRDLAGLLGDDQPFYALQPKGYDGNSPPLSQIEEMATQYVREIQELQPVGPYRIGGYCMGGLVAYEIARQLPAESHRDNLIILIDTEFPHAKSLHRLLSRKRIDRISQMTSAGILAAACAEICKIYKSAIRNLWASINAFFISGQALERVATFSPGPDSMEIQNANTSAQNNYAPKSYDGDVIFICVESTGASSTATHADWHELITGASKIIELSRSGDKYDYKHLFHEPYLTLLANALKKVL